MFHKKIKKKSVDVFKRLFQDQFDTSHAVSQLDFFQKYTGCHVVAVKSLFLQPKMERKYLSRKLCLQNSTLIFRELPRTLLIEPIGPRAEVFPKTGSSEFSVTSYTIIFYP